MDIALLVYLSAWYGLNYYYNIFNKLSGKAGGGTEFVFTLAWAQMAIGSVYALALWVAPEARPFPKLTMAQFLKMAPVGFFSAAAHAATVFSLTAGAVSFAQVVKAAEPAFAAAVGYLVYGKTVSKAKIAMLFPIIGGICIASAQELDFTIGALVAASGANLAAAFKGAESKKVMEELKAAGLTPGNAYAIQTLWASIILVPLIFIMGEASKLSTLVGYWNADGTPGSAGSFRYNMLMSGLTFYLYNEVSTLALDKLSGVTHSVANTAKRAIIIVGCAIAFGESLAPLKLLGCTVAILGTFLYAVADSLFPGKAKAA